MYMGTYSKDNKEEVPRDQRRIFSDAAVIKMRDDFAKSGLAATCFAKDYHKANNMTCAWMSVYMVLLGRSYKYLLPGNPYRKYYDATLAQPGLLSSSPLLE